MSSFKKKTNRLIGQAMHTYKMLKDGDRIIIAVSGGVDSLALAWTLKKWQEKAPIRYELLAVHLDMGFDEIAYKKVEEQLKLTGIPYLIERTSIGMDAYNNTSRQNACFICAKKRRNYLFQMAKDKNYSKIAFGHHKDDIIETLFINMCYSGNISTMVPCQHLFNGNLSIIRPLAHLTKSEVIEIADAANLTPVKNPCPMAEFSKLEEIRAFLNSFFETNPSFKDNIFASLSNVRGDYLLKKVER